MFDETFPVEHTAEDEFDADSDYEDDEDGYVDPLLSPGGFLPYSDLGEDPDNRIAQAA